MRERRLFVFRVHTDDYVDYIKAELKQGRLRQGWGFGSLLDAGGVPDPEAYVKAFREEWPDSPEDPYKRYSILERMLAIEPGDLLVIPNVPVYRGEFTIAEVTEPYRFEHTPGFERRDFGHIIGVDPSNMREVGYHSSYEARVVSGMFRSYQQAVNNSWHPGFAKAVMALWGREETSEQAVAPGWVWDLQQRVFAGVRERIADLRPLDVEKLVEKAFEQAGYELQRRNNYDGRGGDADLVFHHRLPLLSEVDGDRLKVFVQVKHKKGVDQEDWRGVEQLNRIADGERYVLKVLFSTATDFTEKTQALAQESEVVLIYGDQAMAFLSRGLTGGLTGDVTIDSLVAAL